MNIYVITAYMLLRDGDIETPMSDMELVEAEHHGAASHNAQKVVSRIIKPYQKAGYGVVVEGYSVVLDKYS